MLRVVVLVLVGCLSAVAQEGAPRTQPIYPDESIADVQPFSLLDIELPTDQGMSLFPQMDDDFIPDEPEGIVPTLPDIIEAQTALEKNRALSVRYREVRTRVEQRPELVALRGKAKAAKTFEDERAALREYYRTLFAQITKADESLAEKCQVMEAAFLDRLEQKRIDPTIPRTPTSALPKTKPINP